MRLQRPEETAVTRRDTLDTALQLHNLAVKTVGEIPFVLLLNKVDLKETWDLETRKVGELVDQGWLIRETSAKSGEHVEEAFHQLEKQML